MAGLMDTSLYYTTRNLVVFISGRCALAIFLEPRLSCVEFVFLPIRGLLLPSHNPRALNCGSELMYGVQLEHRTPIP